MSSSPWVRALLHSVYDPPDAASVHPRSDRVLDALAGKAALRGRALEAARANVAPFMPFVWRQIWDNNPPTSGSTGRWAGAVYAAASWATPSPRLFGHVDRSGATSRVVPWPGEGDSACAGSVDA